MAALQSVIETLLPDPQAADHLMTLVTIDTKGLGSSTIGVLMRDVMPSFMARRGEMMEVTNRQMDVDEPVGMDEVRDS